MKRILHAVLFLAMATVAVGQTLPIIPYPQSVTKHSGTVDVSMAEQVKFETSDTLGREAYKLNITEDGITVTSSSEAGRFYALQSLEQMKMASTDGTLPQVDIYDYPLLQYRSFMLDCSRHFFTKDAIKRILKVMSFYKVNFFHWHLCDDQGWRIEIPEYPRLTEVGSIRKGSLTLKDNPFFYDDTEYGRGCYYTLDDLREIVAYAQELSIEIIPEYDLPGHNMAAIAAYPELSCDSTKSYEVRIAEGNSTDVLNVGDDKVIDFMKCVLGHLAEIFPSKYMHLGGDECPTTVWQTNEMCKKRIKDEGLSGVNDLQPWLLEKLGSWLRDTYGKQVVAWDELVSNWKTSYTIKPIIMCYRNGLYADQAKAAAAKGLMSIMTPTTPCYFDQMQCSTSQAEFDEIYQGGYGANWVNTVQDVYNFNPLGQYTTSTKDMCFGTQGSLWTEACVSEAEMQYQLLPRMLAVAENGWLPATKKNWTSFYNRLQQHGPMLDEMGYCYGKHYIKSTLTTLQKQQAEAKRLLEATNAGETGYVSAEAKATLQAALDASTTASELLAANKAYKASEVVMPQDGALYEIRSAATYYLQRYLGSSLYRDNGMLKIHYTAQAEPQELWICRKNENGKYTFTSGLDGKELTVNGSTELTVEQATTANSKYDYDPGVLLLKSGFNYLYANANGSVTYNTEHRLGYPSSWRLVEIKDFRHWMETLKTKCEQEIAEAKPNTIGYRKQEAYDYLQKEVVEAIEARLGESETVTRSDYEAMVARYKAYLDMPKSSYSDAIDEGCYYYIQNAYFTDYYAYAAESTQGVNITGGKKSTSDTYRWRFEKQTDGTVRIFNKAGDRAAYVSTYTEESIVKCKGSFKCYFTLQQLTTDQGQTGVAIIEKNGLYSWYLNPGGGTNVILRPYDWGASIWNLIKIADDATDIKAVGKANGMTTNAMYDLQGRELMEMPQTKGIYIVNGKKVAR